jgi:hypothetical protein
MNVFLFTDRPEKAFTECRALIRSERIASGLSAAYRDIESGTDLYVRLWPREVIEPFTLM